MLLLALGHTDGQFDQTRLVVHIQRHHRVTGSLHLGQNFFDLVLVQQQFACADWIGMDVGGGILQGADVRAEQVQRAVADGDVRFLQLHAPGTDGFDFPALQHDAGFKFIFYDEVVKRFFILNYAHER